jgi:hypothetical protein
LERLTPSLDLVEFGEQDSHVFSYIGSDYCAYAFSLPANGRLRESALSLRVCSAASASGFRGGNLTGCFSGSVFRGRENTYECGPRVEQVIAHRAPAGF